MEPYIMSRFGPPGPMDEAPFGTICKLVHSDNNKEPENIEIHVQISNDNNKPNWISFGSYTNKSDDDIKQMVQQTLKR